MLSNIQPARTIAKYHAYPEAGNEYLAEQIISLNTKGI